MCAAMRARFTFAIAAAITVLAPASAYAYDSLAAPCATDPNNCGIGAIWYDKTDALPIQFNFDTGWVPQGSPLQVHIWADVWANTHVSLTGQLQNEWPSAMTLSAP